MVAMAEVNCNGCTACCRGPIILHPGLGDNPHNFDCEFVLDVGFRLKRKPDGSCIYLEEHGCSIWPDTPGVCRAFDCRDYALTAGTDDPMYDEAVVSAGEKRLAL